jgi:hypothetical protein
MVENRRVLGRSTVGTGGGNEVAALGVEGRGKVPTDVGFMLESSHA